MAAPSHSVTQAPQAEFWEGGGRFGRVVAGLWLGRGRVGLGGPTWVLVVQVVHIGDEAIVGEQEAHAGQQHCEVDGVVAVVRHRLIDR